MNDEGVWLHMSTLMSHAPEIQPPEYGNGRPGVDWVPDNYQLWQIDDRLYLVTWCQECHYEAIASLEAVLAQPRERGSRNHRAPESAT